ncbi:hypothetical protein STEG23_012635, partial [Scotinomys teguina]
MGKAGRLTNSATTQNEDYKTAHSNTYLIYELLACVKGSDLQIQSYRISMIPDNNRVSKRSPGIWTQEQERSSRYKLNNRNGVSCI